MEFYEWLNTSIGDYDVLVAANESDFVRIQHLLPQPLTTACMNGVHYFFFNSKRVAISPITMLSIVFGGQYDDPPFGKQIFMPEPCWQNCRVEKTPLRVASTDKNEELVVPELHLLDIQENCEKIYRGEIISVGRGDGNGVRIMKSTVSRYHAVFRFENNGWTIEDIGSKNGTEVNAQKLSLGQRVTLKQGDTIAFAESMKYRLL